MNITPERMICVKPSPPHLKEAQLHRIVSQLLTLVLPAPIFWTTVPLGGGGKIRGAILKGMGVKAGTPDIMILYNGRTYFIELKTKKGRVDTEQAACHADLIVAGAEVGIARSVDDVLDLLARWQIPTRAVVGLRS